MIPAIFRKDSYKLGHADQYPEGTTKVYSNFTPRSTRHLQVPEAYRDNKIVWFGISNFLYNMIDQWTEFFGIPYKEVNWDYIEKTLNPFCGAKGFNISRYQALHKLGYLPLEIRCLPEGSIVGEGIPVLTITNTKDEFYWLPNDMETWLSADLWKPSTSATIARIYNKILRKWSDKTGSNKDFIAWQAHDFSARGMSGIEDAAVTGMGHLLFSSGTDNIPAVIKLMEVYDKYDDFIGGSVPATEHSVMCAGGKESEIETFRRLIKIYPSGVFSVVSDTWDFWNVLTVIAPALKEEILGRTPDALGLAKVVFRPDSGDPVKIICGDLESDDWRARKGAVELLWDVFGGTTNEKGYKTLNQRVGLIYGDSITMERMELILAGLAAKGFASDNVVFGIGSYTYQYVTRDTLGFAMKATYVTVNGESFEIFKDPVTDSGTKRSAKGLLQVIGENGNYKLIDQVSQDEADNQSALELVFYNWWEPSLYSWEEVVARANIQ